MNAIRTALRELAGLFVEDPIFAIALIGWLAIFALAGHVAGAAVRGPILFLGFAVILVADAYRASRASGRPS